MKLEPILVIFLAYLTSLVQSVIFSAWPIWGGLPHLIALFAIFFLVFNRPGLGFVWIIAGGMIIDLGLPFPVGITLFPLVLIYSIVHYFSLRFLPIYNPISIIGFGIIMLGASELILAAITGDWRQLLIDLRSGLIIVPLAFLASRRLKPYELGLRIKM